jgi:hypothetical protein
MFKLAHHGAAAHRVRSVTIALLAVAAMLFVATSARAAGAAGPVDASGIPIFYQDATGLQLAPCLLGLPNCVSTLADLNAKDGEAFYLLASADLTDPSGASFKFTAAVEAANLNGLITFGRIRITGRGLAPNTEYTILEPYGDLTVTSDAGGIAKDTTDIGCGAAPCAFDAALASPVFGGFLQWDPAAGAPPAGFIGDNVTPHKVIGSPIARNSVTITGGGLSLFTDQFVIQGQLAAGATPPGQLPPAAPPAPHLLATDDTGINKTDNITKVAAPSIVGATTPKANVTVLVDGIAGATGAAAADGSFTIKLAAPVADGSHVITVKAANPLSGAASPVSPPLTISVDTAAPAAPSQPKTSQATAASFGATFTGSAEADSTVTLLDGGDAFGSGPATGGSYSIKGNALGIGVHQISATATDVAGNTSAASSALALPVGSIAAPSAPALGASSDSGTLSTDGITNVSKPTLTGSLPFANGAVRVFADGRVIGAATAAGGTYTVTPADALADGQHVITVTATDSSTGLESPPSAGLRITIDTVAPAAPSKPNAAARATEGSAVAVTGTADSATTVTVFVDGSSVTTASSSSGSWTVSLSGLGAGSHTIEASATDIAGNVSPRSQATTVTVTAPKAPAKKTAAPGKRTTTRVSIVAIGAVPRARFSGNVATLNTAVTIAAASRVTVSASAGSRPLTLLRGSSLGGTRQQGARATSLARTGRTTGNVGISLRIPRAQVTARGDHRIVLRATDTAGHTTTLKIAFRVS